MSRRAPSSSRADLESSLDAVRSALSGAESDLDDIERRLEAMDVESPYIAPVIEAARRLWPDFDYRATNRFVPEDALMEAIRDLERKA